MTHPARDVGTMERSTEERFEVSGARQAVSCSPPRLSGSPSPGLRPSSPRGRGFKKFFSPREKVPGGRMRVPVWENDTAPGARFPWIEAWQVQI